MDAPIIGASDSMVCNIAAVADYDEHSIIFTTQKNIDKPVACLISREPHPLAKACIIVPDPKGAMKKLLTLLELPSYDSAFQGIHPSASISKKAQIGKEVTIGPFAIIEDHVQVGDHSVIGGHVHLMHHVTLGEYCRIESGAVIYPHTTLGQHVLIGAKTVLGDTGFGYDWDNGWSMFPQIGKLIIEDHVHVGPLSVIDRGALHNTLIGKGSKLDAQMMIGHGVQIGQQVIMAARAAIGGSSTIGNMTMAGGCVQIADHVSIAAGTRLSGSCNVASSIRTPGEYASGMPAMTSVQWRRWLRFLLRTVTPSSSDS